MYVQDGEIDRELFEISSEHIVFSNLSGFVKEKYAYVCTVRIFITQVKTVTISGFIQFIIKIVLLWLRKKTI